MLLYSCMFLFSSEQKVPVTGPTTGLIWVWSLPKHVTISNKTKFSTNTNPALGLFIYYLQLPDKDWFIFLSFPCFPDNNLFQSLLGSPGSYVMGL